MSKILFLSSWFPYPANNGSKIRVLNLVRELARKNEVTLVSFADEADANQNAAVLRQTCRDVRVIPAKQFATPHRSTRSSFLSGTPRSLVDTYSPEMEHCITTTVREQQHDVVIASQLTMASYRDCFEELPALFEEVEVGVLYDRYANASSIKQRVRHGLTWAKHRRYLARLLPRYRACTVVSEREQELVGKLANEPQVVKVIPNALDLTSYAEVVRKEKPNTLVFTGSFRYRANYDAMVWFLQEVYPKIVEQIPGVHLIITGDRANMDLPLAKNVTLTGYVDDVRPLIASAGISLAPLRVGGGTRFKILEAMALRTPVVATTKGAEGLEARHNEHLLIADTSDEYADAVLRLLRDPGLRERLACNAYQLLQDKYDWAAVVPQFMDLIERIGRSRVGSPL